jgi:TonB-dependent starch-binding outer membrane protein SusC
MSKLFISIFYLLIFCITVNAQKHVRGTVYESEMGDKLKNVTVKIDGTDFCSTTDSLGNYKITVPSEKSYLYFTCEGYDPLFAKVKRNYEINVVLGQLLVSDRDVNVGYGTQRSTEVTGAVASIGGGQYHARSFVSSTKKLKKKK